MQDDHGPAGEVDPDHGLLIAGEGPVNDGIIHQRESAEFRCIAVQKCLVLTFRYMDGVIAD